MSGEDARLRLDDLLTVCRRYGFDWTDIGGEPGLRLVSPDGMPPGIMRQVVLTPDGAGAWSFAASYFARDSRTAPIGDTQPIGGACRFTTLVELDALLAQIGLRSIPPPFGPTWRAL